MSEEMRVFGVLLALPQCVEVDPDDEGQIVASWYPVSLAFFWFRLLDPGHPCVISYELPDHMPGIVRVKEACEGCLVFTDN